MKWRLLIWAALAMGTAAAVGLGVAVIVVGVNKAAGLAGVMAAFCELGALVLGVVGWVGGRATAGRSGPDTSSIPAPPVMGDRPVSSTAETYAVDARGAKGIQTGEGNIQYNDFR
jgi:hypothetical protein